MSLSNWFHERSQPGRGRQALLQRNDEEEDIESVTTIMSARSGNALRRPMLVRCSPVTGRSPAPTHAQTELLRPCETGWCSHLKGMAFHWQAHMVK